ncbi:MAG: putative glycerol-1-phosphate prenyltransferase [Bacteroidetes bacterium]|nr:MAG: putative glycerol-1-phosphate prenyltransferase [Bacteroidota bacterium]
MSEPVYQHILDKKKAGKKCLAVLIDPDKTERLDFLLEHCNKAGVDFLLIGGSLLTNGSLDACITAIRKKTAIPVVLFPGSVMQISAQADALLLLSVISGRNPELLIGRHVMAAPLIRKSGLEVLPTGYMLIESGRSTAASYMSNTSPLPRHHNDIAACTALAGEQLGMKMIYLEAGSGAQETVTTAMIEAVRQVLTVPLITGGGIRTVEKAVENCKAGADIIVVGNVLEEKPELVGTLAAAVHSF